MKTYLPKASEIEKDWIFTTTGVVTGVGMCMDAFTQPGDEIVLFTPVYHAFAKVIRQAGRVVAERQMPIVDGRYAMDFDAWDAQMTGREKLPVILLIRKPDCELTGSSCKIG